MARFRLRFAFQEIDLPEGAFLIGRAPHCQLTIDDPLVSREHARIAIMGGDAVIQDLNSRNGVFVNGKAVEHAVGLEDGDRIRIGPQELVFGVTVSEVEQSASRSTGTMCYCRTCGVPFALSVARCPSCGARERERHPSSSRNAVDPDWGLRLAADALVKAIGLHAWQDAERLLKSVRVEVDRRVTGNMVLDRDVLALIADAATNLSVARSDAGWARWVLSIYARLAEFPATRLARSLTTLPPEERSTLVPAARRVMESVATSGGPRPENLGAYRDFEDFIARLSGV